MSELDELYQEVILDHYKNPRCKGCILNPDASSALANPLCGDQIDLCIAVNDGAVSDIKFCGHGCSISQASCSMMADLCKGHAISEVESIIGDFRSMMRGEKGGEDLPSLGDAAALQGVRRFSARVKCAMLGWEAMEKCLGCVRNGSKPPTGELVNIQAKKP